MNKNPHSAPGPNAGFQYQFERALYWLAQSAAGFRVGIETDDDVSVRGTAERATLEQDKHSIRQNANPFGDRSRDLWNTLNIWVDALDTRSVPSSTRFLMVTNKPVGACIARQISDAISDAAIDACIDALIAAAESPTDDIAASVERVLMLGSRDNLRRVIANCELADSSSGSVGVELRRQTANCLQLPGWFIQSADSILDELLGWVHRTALAMWQAQKPAWIERDHFVNHFHAILDRRSREVRRERAEHLLPVADADVGKEKGRPFVRQLHLVTEDDDLVDTAIREFIRCNIEKSRLSADGNISDDDWRAFEDALFSRWKKIRSRVTRMRRGGAEADIGFEIFSETTENYRERLAGADTEQVYLTSGTYHRLADITRVGWHPQFEDLMRDLLKRS